jgi:hypothetical protein
MKYDTRSVDAHKFAQELIFSGFQTLKFSFASSILIILNHWNKKMRRKTRQVPPPAEVLVVGWLVVNDFVPPEVSVHLLYVEETVCVGKQRFCAHTALSVPTE